MTSNPEHRKEYEWYLKETGMVRSPSGMRMKCLWAGCDIKYTIREDHLINPDGTAGPRLTELIHRLAKDSVVKQGQPLIPSEYIRHGMHLFAEVQRHYLETRKEECLWEFTYDTISPTSLSTSVLVPDVARKKILFQAGHSKSVKEVTDRVAAIDPSLLTWLNHMIKSGEVKFS